MGAFWVTWPYWGRMCFFLALSILLVFIGGLCKMRYSKRKEQKFLAIAERERAQEQMYGPHDIDKMRRDAVPFGIRALENNNGTYTDGVWDATSMIACLEPLVIRGNRGDHSSSNSITSFQLPPPLKFNRDAFESRSSLSLNRESTGFERLVVEEPDDGSDDSPENKFKLPAIQRNSLTLDALEGAGRASGPPIRQLLDVAHDSELDRESDSSDRLPRQAGHYVPRRPAAGRSHTTSDALATRRPSGIDLLPFTEIGDLAGLHKHRLSHAAEIGQLLPRVRRRELSGDYTPSITPSGASTQKDGGEYSNQQSYRSDHHSSTAADQAEQTAAPAAVPFQDFVESHPIPPQEPAYQPRSSDESIRPVSAADPPSNPNFRYNGHSHRNSATRIVNSGFEVHPAGTFGGVGEPSDWNIDVEGGERKEARKLRKKRRSSSVFQEDIS